MHVQSGFAEGSPGVTLDEVAHLMIPGRYRSADGMGLSDLTVQRVDTAANFYIDEELASSEGVIVASGYKNPNDQAGKRWKNVIDEEFVGIPEAYSMSFRLLGHWSISAANVRVEPHSINTVANFINSQNLFPDERPVGIVAQEQHLERILDIIAPKTMKRPYVGLVVPELADQNDKDGFLSKLVSRWVLRGISPETADISKITEARSKKVWKVVNAAQLFKPGV